MPLMGQFYEWTNTIFERLAVGGKFYKENDAMQLSNSGYEALAPLGSMLACALGMPESEFAKIKDRGRDYEAKLLESMFPRVETDGSKDIQISYGSDVLKKAKDIFNKIELDTSFSLNKKRINQNLFNELYAECLEIMKRRIENELQSGHIEDLEKYKKYQMFYLKKINFNFKSASKSNGFRFLRAPIIQDIGFCNDKISKHDLLQIAQEHIAMTELGFDDSTLGKYSKAIMTPSKGKESSFIERLKVSPYQIADPKEPSILIDNDVIEGDRENGANVQSRDD